MFSILLVVFEGDFLYVCTVFINFRGQEKAGNAGIGWGEGERVVYPPFLLWRVLLGGTFRYGYLLGGGKGRRMGIGEVC